MKRSLEIVNMVWWCIQGGERKRRGRLRFLKESIGLGIQHECLSDQSQSRCSVWVAPVYKAVNKNRTPQTHLRRRSFHCSEHSTKCEANHPKSTKALFRVEFKINIECKHYLKQTCQLFSSPAFLLVRTPSLQGSSIIFIDLFLLFLIMRIGGSLCMNCEIRIDCQICPLQEQFVTAEPSFQLLHILL